MKENDKIIRLSDVCNLVGLSKAQIYHLISKNEFPPQIKLGERASGWVFSEVLEWCDSKIKLSRKGGL